MDIIPSLGVLQNAGSFVNYSAAQVVLNIFFALVLSILVALVYQYTHRGYSYSKNFVTSLVLIALISTLVIMVIGNSLVRAFALLGTFSIIRFRTAIKDTRDISFVFLCLVLGMAVGTNNYTMALVGTVFIILIILALDKLNITGAEKTQYTLSILTKNGKRKLDQKILGKFLRNWSLINMTSRENGKSMEHLFAVDLKKGVDSEEFMEAMSKTEGIEKVNLFSTKEELEY